MKTWKIEITCADYEQIAIGAYGSENLPPAFAEAVNKKDAEFFIRMATGVYTPMYDARRKDGTFRTKSAAEAVLNNIKGFNLIGQGWNMAKGKPAFGMVIKIIASA